MPDAQEDEQTVLIVDDDADILESLAGYLELERPALHVLTASSGPAGLEILERREVHAVVSDLRMPGMDGIEFLHRARQFQPNSPRILITAHQEIALVDRAVKEAGIQAVLSKPFEVEDFAHALDHALAVEG